MKRIKTFFSRYHLRAFVTRLESKNLAVWVQAISTVVLIIITAYYACTTNKLLKVSVDPQISFDVEEFPVTQLVISNDGPFRLVDVSVDPHTTIYIGPPRNQKAFKVSQVPTREASSHWWYMANLGPGEVQRKSISELGQSALMYAKQEESLKSGGHLEGISPQEQVQFYPAVVFNMKAHREMDHKLYMRSKGVLVFSDTNTGKPIFTTLESVAFPYLTEIVKDVSKQER